MATPSARIPCTVPRPSAAAVAMAFVLTALGAASSAPAQAPTAGRKVIAAIAVDSYGDLKQQLAWIGPHVDNPGLAAAVESLLLVATQGKGLNGLDVKRPIGIFVTTKGGDIGVHAAIPVSNLEKLLGSLQGVTGAVEKDGDVRRMTIPSGQDLELVEKDGWAIVNQRGQSLDIADPAAVLGPLVADATLTVDLHPADMPESIRALLSAGIQQMAGAAAAQGRKVDARALQQALDGLAGVETLSLSMAMDPKANTVFLENKVVARDAASGPAASTPLTVATAVAHDGGLHAVKAHAVAPLTRDQARRLLALLEGAMPAGDETARTVSLVVRGLVEAMADAGGLDTALTIDTSVTGQLPVITAGAHVADGPALERAVKELFASQRLPREVKATFDSGKIGKANLHTVSIDVSASPAAGIVGPAVELTLAVTPDYAFLLHGGDVEDRLEKLLATNGSPNSAVADDEIPGMAIALALDRILAYAASMGLGPQAEAAATQAATLTETDPDSGSVILTVKPVEGGAVTRLSAGTGVIKAAAEMARQQPGGPGVRPAPAQRAPAGTR